jgi:hypothetical protein
MAHRWIWAITLSFAVSAQAAERVSLLGGQSLRLGVVMAQADTPLSLPPPPPPPDSPVPPAAVEEEPPSLGAVLGFMISGGAVAVSGVGFTLGGLFDLALGAAVSPTDTTGAATSIAVIGLVLCVVGLVLDGVGLFLLLHGNNLRKERNAYNESRGITDAPPRAPTAPAPLLAWRF